MFAQIDVSEYETETVDQLPSQPFLICGSSVCPSSVVRDLGVWIDDGLTMSTHITKVVSGCFASLRQLRSVRRSSQESSTRLVVALCYRVWTTPATESSLDFLPARQLMHSFIIHNLYSYTSNTMHSNIIQH